MTFLIISIVIVSLPILHLIESMSWSIKAMADSRNAGYVIARTNIFLYGARFFFFAFNSLTYFLIESGITESQIYAILIISFIITCCLQFLIINENIVARICKITVKTSLQVKFVRLFDFKIFLHVSVVNMLFVIAIILPIILVINFPLYRLTLSSTAPILNAIGTAILLIFIDTRLYGSMDKGDLHTLIFTYMCGRISGFFFGIFLLAFLIL